MRLLDGNAGPPRRTQMSMWLSATARIRNAPRPTGLGDRELLGSQHLWARRLAEHDRLLVIRDPKCATVAPCASFGALPQGQLRLPRDRRRSRRGGRPRRGRARRGGARARGRHARGDLGHAPPLGPRRRREGAGGAAARARGDRRRARRRQDRRCHAPAARRRRDASSDARAGESQPRHTLGLDHFVVGGAVSPATRCSRRLRAISRATWRDARLAMRSHSCRRVARYFGHEYTRRPALAAAVEPDTAAVARRGPALPAPRRPRPIAENGPTNPFFGRGAGGSSRPRARRSDDPVSVFPRSDGKAGSIASRAHYRRACSSSALPPRRGARLRRGHGARRRRGRCDLRSNARRPGGPLSRRIASTARAAGAGRPPPGEPRAGTPRGEGRLGLERPRARAPVSRR